MHSFALDNICRDIILRKIGHLMNNSFKERTSKSVNCKTRQTKLKELISSVIKVVHSNQIPSKVLVSILQINLTFPSSIITSKAKIKFKAKMVTC